jgi:hypothetical protein
MTTVLPQPSLQLVYQLSDNLRAETPIFGVRRVAPSEGEREELLLSKLGAKGWGRLHYFRHYYSAGWGGGSGKPLSPRALETFYRFLESAKFPEGSVPSVFLTDEGCIEVSWEDPASKAVQVEFRPAEIEFYVEAQQLEDSVPASEVKELARRLAV